MLVGAARSSSWCTPARVGSELSRWYAWQFCVHVKFTPCVCAPKCSQGEAIAVNLREMFGMRVPILSVVIGEGGSGGALAIGCANHNLIMEHAVYYVASPEACAAILWKSRDKAATVRVKKKENQ